MEGSLRLRLLGSVQVERAGEPVCGFESRKALALLCYLVVRDQPVSRSYLADLFWGDKPEARGRGNLSRVLHNLSTLLPGCLQADRYTVQFCRPAALWLDVDAFDQLAASGSPDALTAAVELYRDDFMAGFYLDGCPEFDSWLVMERERWHRRVVEILSELIDDHVYRGEYKQGLGFAFRMLELDPWREEAHRQVMHLLARSGQRCAALAQYDTCRRTLAEELSVGPAKETTALYERIRNGKLSQEAERQESKRDFAAVPTAPPPFLYAAAKHPGPTAPFVARERELAQLDGFLDLALAGQGRVTFVTGEAGCGKTALIQEFARRAQEKQPDLAVASGNCNAHTGIGDPYLPFREILGLLTGDVEALWAVGAIDRQQACRLWAMIPHAVQALVNTGPDLIDIFVSGPALSTRAATAAPSPSTGSEHGGAGWLVQLERLLAQKEAGQARANLEQSDLFEQYTKVLQALAQEAPLLLVLDDLQWADAGSISLLFHLGRRLERSRILIVGIYRPVEVAMGRDEARHPLEPVISEFQRHFGNIRIELRQSEDRQFVEALIDTEPNRLGAVFREPLYRHTRGHALFTVEMLRGMQERGDLIKDETGRWVEGPAVNWQTLPARVEGVIGERIDRLPGPQREALKVASVEGESFTAEVVARVRGIDEREMVRQLSSGLGQKHRLVRGQGSQRLGPGGQCLSYYRFRHILFQKYIYNSLDEVERVYLHEAVGNALERLYGEQTETVAVQLARHFQAAGITDKAIDYLQQASEKAGRSYAYQEAITLLNEALTLLSTLPDSPEHAWQELALQVALGNALIAIRGFAAPEVKQAYDRARELCGQVGETPQLFPVMHGLFRFYGVRAELQTARELAEQILRLTQQQQDTSLLLPAQLTLGIALSFTGEFAPALEHLAQDSTHYDLQRHHAYAPLYGQDPMVTCLTQAAWVLWHLGYADQALEKSHEALTLAQELAHPFSIAQALCHSGWVHQFRREARATQEQSEALLALCSEQGFAFWAALGTILRGWALAEQGLEKGIAQIRQGLAAWQATGAEMFVPYFLALQVEAYGQEDQAEVGLSLLDEALAVAHKNGDRFYEAELYRLKGELLLKAEGGRGKDESPEACFLKAIEIARRQSARSLELRAVMNLSRLWQRQGKKEEARQMLAEIYNWFTEGFDTADLKEARTLLEEMW